MTNLTAEQRLSDLELVLKTVIIFNTNAIATLSRRVTGGNPAIAAALANDLAALKSNTYISIDKGLFDGYVDSLITVITGKL